MAEFGNLGRLGQLCVLSKAACTALAPMVMAFYSSISDETAKLKSDKSYFTIADGIVQHLLVEHLFSGDKFANIVGEEDGTSTKVCIDSDVYKVDDLLIPTEFYSLVDSAKSEMNQLSKMIDADMYHDLTVFIDPIDGTREFSTGLGEQCTICIGFSDANGKAVAGVVFRPLSLPAPTYAIGAAAEGFCESNLLASSSSPVRGLLTSNGSISPFIKSLISKLGFERIPSGGAGNKMLMLLEGKGAAYIQDRGVSRWDTAGAQAVLEAHGGILCKLTKFMTNEKTLESYTYLQAKDGLNLDFEENTAVLTPYNAASSALKIELKEKKSPQPIYGRLTDFAPYSNLCGLLALSQSSLNDPSLGIDFFYHAVMASANENSPSFD